MYVLIMFNSWIEMGTQKKVLDVKFVCHTTDPAIIKFNQAFPVPSDL